MRTGKDQLVLGGAFAAAVALHAAVLPWVGAAVGREASSHAIDLAVQAIDSPAHAEAGQAVRVRVQLAEMSRSGVVPSDRFQRRDVLWLSRARRADERDAVLADIGVAGVWKSDKIDQVLNPKVDLPADADGPYWLIYHADADNELPDRDRGNNTRAVPIYIDGPQQPELTIDSFSAPDQAAPGGSVLIDLAVTNTGQGWANRKPNNETTHTAGGWTDRIYLSVNDTLDETDIELRGFDRHAPLGPDDGYAHERMELAIPRGVSGPMHLIAVADAGQVLDQPSFTAGVSVRPITLVDPGTPDLLVASIDKPDRLVISRPTPVNFSVANLGGVATVGSGWVDGVYLSRDAVLDATSVPITQVPAGQPLQPRARYASSVAVTLPESIEPGRWYLIITADSGQAVDENGFDDNNALAVPIMVLTEEQADAEIQLGRPDRPERLVVQWIEHDRVEEHVARLSRTVQPALQDRADPVADAPANNFPEPPAVNRRPDQAAGDPANPRQPIDQNNQQAAAPKPTEPDATRTDLAPRPQDPGSPTPQRIDGLPGTDGDAPPRRVGIDQPMPPTDPRPIDPTPGDQDSPTPDPGDRRVDSPADPAAPDTDRTTDSPTPADQESDTDSDNPDENDSDQPSERMKETESDEQTDNPDTDDPSEADDEGDANDQERDESTTDKPSDDPTPKPDGKDGSPATPSEEQTPTRTPRDDSEAPPTNNREVEVALQEGRVLVGEGIKVTTKLPIPPGTGSRRLSLPRNARVRVTFTSDGKVHDARMIRSTTYREWDAAIEASLYNWKAEGEAVKNADPYIVIEWTYLLNELLERDE